MAIFTIDHDDFFEFPKSFELNKNLPMHPLGEVNNREGFRPRSCEGPVSKFVGYALKAETGSCRLRKMIIIKVTNSSLLVLLLLPSTLHEPV